MNQQNNKDINNNNNNDQKVKVQVEQRRRLFRRRTPQIRNNQNKYRNNSQIRNNRTNQLNRGLSIGRNYFNKKFNNVIKAQNPKSINLNIFRDDKNMVITGKDIILTQDTVLNENGLYAMIPINPAYWDNTRIKNLAVLNQYYIPINIKIEYVPLVSKFQKGNITIGTIANTTMSENNIQSTLISSTSGITYSCSNNFTRDIQIKSLIPQKKLLINSKLDKESVPFYICIYFNNIKDQENDILPGQFYINYMFKFFNPITVPSKFKSQQNIKLNQFASDYLNISAILTQENNNYKIGTIIDVEMRENQYKYYINGTEIQLNTEKLATFMYSESINQQIQPEPQINYDLSLYSDSGISQSVTFDNGNDILVVVNKNLSNIEVYLLYYGQTTATLTIRSSYYKFFKKSELETDLPDPLTLIETSITQLDQQQKYTKLYLQPINVNFITP
jgi:hypothetical protein